VDALRPGVQGTARKRRLTGAKVKSKDGDLRNGITLGKFSGSLGARFL